MVACNRSAVGYKFITPHTAITTVVGQHPKRGRRVLIAESSLARDVREIVLETLLNSQRPRLACALLVPPSTPFVCRSKYKQAPDIELYDRSVCAA